MTPEQRARDLLERMGIEGARHFTAGEVGELANLIAASTPNIESMVDRVMPPDDGGYHGCPLCDYTGHWNCTMGDRNEQRGYVRDMLTRAIGAG